MSGHTNSKTTILLVDSHPPTRTGISSFVSSFPDMEIVGEADNGLDAQFLASKLYPRLIMFDLNMPDLPPTSFAKWVRENFPQTALLVLTSHANKIPYLTVMMEAGAVGYLSKTISADELAANIRRVASGELVFDNQQMIAAYQWKKEVYEKIKCLTHQEIEVVKLLLKGKNNQAIADILNISLKTVTYHLTSLFSKLQVHSRLEATLWAIEHLLDNLDFFPYPNRDKSLG